MRPRPIVLGRDKAPSYRNEITETPTRVTYLYHVGGADCIDLFCGNHPYSSMIRHNVPYGEHQNPKEHRIDPYEIPEKLRDHVDPTYWAEFASSVIQATSKTFPPPCRCCVFSCFWDVIKQPTYFKKAKATVKHLVMVHNSGMEERGVKITAFDKSGSYYSSWVGGGGASMGFDDHLVFGFFLDIAGSEETHGDGDAASTPQPPPEEYIIRE